MQMQSLAAGSSGTGLKWALVLGLALAAALLWPRLRVLGSRLGAGAGRRRQRKVQAQVQRVELLAERLARTLEECAQWLRSDHAPAREAATQLSEPLRRAKRMIPALQAQAGACQLDRADGGKAALVRLSALLDEFDAARLRLQTQAGVGLPAIDRTGIAEAVACARATPLERRRQVFETLEGAGASTDFGGLSVLQTPAKRSTDGHSILGSLIGRRAGPSADVPRHAGPSETGLGTDQLSWIASTLIDEGTLATHARPAPDDVQQPRRRQSDRPRA